MTGEFFAIGMEQWVSACGLGLNPAVAFLVLACGTGRDNVTTRWSAHAVSRWTGMSWRRACDAIIKLERAGLLVRIGEPGKWPTYKLMPAADWNSALWLPNTLVTSAAGEISPVAKLRQAQNVEFLQAFIALYGLHDLPGDGGLPRHLLRASFDREFICDGGQYRVYGFNSGTPPTCATNGPLARFRNREVDGEHMSWVFLNLLERLGLLETVDYLAESDEPTAELIHPLNGDELASNVLDAASAAADALPEGYRQHALRYEYTLPVIRDYPAPAVVRVYRLTYRPHTTLTAAWRARHIETCECYTRVYSAIARRDFQHAVTG